MLRAAPRLASAGPKFRPLADRILVRKVVAETKTASAWKPIANYANAFILKDHKITFVLNFFPKRCQSGCVKVYRV